MWRIFISCLNGALAAPCHFPRCGRGFLVSSDITVARSGPAIERPSKRVGRVARRLERSHFQEMTLEQRFVPELCMCARSRRAARPPPLMESPLPAAAASTTPPRSTKPSFRSCGHGAVLPSHVRRPKNRHRWHENRVRSDADRILVVPTSARVTRRLVSLRPPSNPETRCGEERCPFLTMPEPMLRLQAWLRVPLEWFEAALYCSG